MAKHIAKPAAPVFGVMPDEVEYGIYTGRTASRAAAITAQFNLTMRELERQYEEAATKERGAYLGALTELLNDE